MSTKKALHTFVFLLLILSLSGCMTNPNQIHLKSTKEISTLGKACEDIVRLQIETWDTRDAEKLREIYTDDIVHFDANPSLAGIDKLVETAANMLKAQQSWQMAAGKTYTSQEKCLGEWINWGLLGFTEDNPAVEFDLMETRDGRISFWRLFYDDNFNFFRIDNDLLTQFGNTWSEFDANALLEIYAENVTFQDTLFGVDIEGREGIVDYADSFFALSQGGSWTLHKAFAEGQATGIYKADYPYPSSGGIFSINTTMPDGTSCEVHVAIILTPDENGKIQAQETFYDADTLIACGWVR